MEYPLRHSSGKTATATPSSWHSRAISATVRALAAGSAEHDRHRARRHPGETLRVRRVELHTASLGIVGPLPEKARNNVRRTLRA